MSTTKEPKKTSKKAEAPELLIANTEIKITIPIATAKEAYKKALAKLAPKVKTAGFRQGKVPAHIAEESIGQINIIDQALQDLVPDLYIEEIKKSGKTPLTNPDIKPIKLNMNEDWELVAEIAEKPVFELGDYQKIVKTAKKDAVKEIEAEESKVHDHSHDHDGHDHPEEKPAKGHEGKHTHKLTDKQKEDLTLSVIFKKLVSEIKPQIQELFLREKVRTELRRLEQDLKQVGMTLDDYLTKQQTTFEQFSQQLAVMHLGQIQLEFILQDIITKENLSATEEEISAKIKEITDKLDKKALQDFDEKQYHPYFVTVIERDKVIDFLLKL